MKLTEHPRVISGLRAPTPDKPWRVLLSGCIAGMRCGVDGTDYGMRSSLRILKGLRTIQWLPFCPEDKGLGTPRTMPDIHGGDGFDVIDRKARVLDEHGKDLTDALLQGAWAMMAFARGQNAELAIMTDISAACGSQVIYDGSRMVPEDQKRYRRGVGVATAMLIRLGIPVVSQRDFKTLERLRAKADPDYTPDPEAIDHHETEWFRGYFNTR